MSMETLTRAWEILQDAYQAQMEGDYDRAIELYQSSLELHPTAEAHTFLGWSYHFQGRIDVVEHPCMHGTLGSARILVLLMPSLPLALLTFPVRMVPIPPSRIPFDPLLSD